LIGDNEPDGLARKTEGRKAAEKCKLVKRNKRLWRNKMMTHLWTIAVLIHGDFQLQLLISPHLDDVADSMLNLLGRQFLLGIALRIVNSTILAHQG
jgi:hypothetical protein